VTRTIKTSDSRSKSDCPISIGRSRWWPRVLLVAVVIVGFAIVSYMLVSTDRVLRLSDGVIEDRFFFAAAHVGSRDRESVMAPLRVSRTGNAPNGKVVVIPRAHLLKSRPSPSTYGGRLATQCKTVRDLLVIRNSGDSEIENTWRLIAIRAAAGQSIDNIVDSLAARP
jgi:hypothetical protein